MCILSFVNLHHLFRIQERTLFQLMKTIGPTDFAFAAHGSDAVLVRSAIKASVPILHSSCHHDLLEIGHGMLGMLGRGLEMFGDLGDIASGFLVQPIDFSLIDCGGSAHEEKAGEEESRRG